MTTQSMSNEFFFFCFLFHIEFSSNLKPEYMSSPECTAMTAIVSQNTVNVACKKN